MTDRRDGNDPTAGHGHPDRYAPWLAGLHGMARGQLRRLHPLLAEFIIFGFKQAWACLFGGIMLGLIVLSKAVWRPDFLLTRYDFLFLAAIAVQAGFLALKLEEWREAQVILIFHVVGTIMEIFKTAMGSWVYPEAAFFRIGGVPLFSGFMYACVGSYIARATRILDLHYSDYPHAGLSLLLAAAIYLNFFSHHAFPDLRLGLFAAAGALFFRTKVWFTVDLRPRWMPLLLGFLLVSFFIWVAENIGTATGTWLYPDQKVWRPVSLNKLGAWYLLMIISFVLVNLVHPPLRPGSTSHAGGLRRDRSGL